MFWKYLNICFETDRTPRRTNSSTLICSINTQCLGQVMGRNLDDLDDFFWAVCFPDLDYLRFTENSGSNMQKFIEIMWRLILWVDHWIGPRSRAKWSMYWKWKEPNAKDTMNHWTQSVAQFEIQFFVTSYGFIVHLFHSQIAIIYWSSKPFPRRILQGGAHPVISWFINHYNPHQL